MILLTNPKLLFLKPQKVAGTSFEIALSKFADENAILTPIVEEDEKIRLDLGFRGPQNIMISNLERLIMLFNRTHKDKRYPRSLKFWDHISAKLVKQRLDLKVWSESYKISIIRNPYDSTISSYFYQGRGRGRIVYSPEDFENFCFKIRKNHHKRLKNIDKYFIGKHQIIDFYLRYEAIYEDIKKLENKFINLKGLADLFTQIKAKGQYRPHNITMKEIYHKSPCAQKIVAEIYHSEIKIFGYECL